MGSWSYCICGHASMAAGLGWVTGSSYAQIMAVARELGLPTAYAEWLFEQTRLTREEAIKILDALIAAGTQPRSPHEEEPEFEPDPDPGIDYDPEEQDDEEEPDDEDDELEEEEAHALV
jgi:hypothetical protein